MMGNWLRQSPIFPTTISESKSFGFILDTAPPDRHFDESEGSVMVILVQTMLMYVQGISESQSFGFSLDTAGDKSPPNSSGVSL